MTLNRKELKHVARSVLEALQLLHDDGIVHTGMSSLYLTGLADLVQTSNHQTSSSTMETKKIDLQRCSSQTLAVRPM